MPFTDQDEADLKQTATEGTIGGLLGGSSAAEKRQWKNNSDKDNPRGGTAEANGIADRKIARDLAIGHNEGSSVRWPDGSLKQSTK